MDEKNNQYIANQQSEATETVSAPVVQSKTPLSQKTKLMILIGAITVALIAILIILLGGKGRKYKKAIALIDSGDYEEAYELFLELDDICSWLLNM